MKVLVSDALSEAGLALLAKHADLTVDYSPGLKEDQLVAKIVDADALVIRSGSKVTKKVLEAATKLRVVGRAGIGVDNVDVEAASKRGIVVMNTPTGNAVTTAEHAIALLMSLARKIPQATASMKSGKWEKSKFQGRELAGKTLGVLGLGTIGRIVADRAKGLRMNVIAFDPVLSAERAAQLGVELVSVDQLFRRADAITAHTPLTHETRGIVNDDAIAKMKKGVLLVNCSRGGVYDEAALARGLESGKLGGVALDVFVEEPVPVEHPLLKLDGVILTPHLGASTEEAQERVALEIVEQVIDYLKNGTIANAVNAPNVSREVAPKLAPYLALAHKLGSFIAQVEHVKPRAIEVECVGDPAELGAMAVTRAAVAGILGQFLESPVNEVSAPHVAADRGVAVAQRNGVRRAKYAHLVSVRVEGETGEAWIAEGVVGVGDTAHLTRWRDYELDAQLEGHALVLFNENRPGVIGAVGSILGKRDVNITQVNHGVNAAKAQAVSLWSVETPVPPEALDEIRKAAHVARAVGVALG
ncbi:MAG: phosphoglycerate dehydrogenase [Polyangiaceae bacterium]|jgi:D-3-phosphoglycerate dehydrogenase